MLAVMAHNHDSCGCLGYGHNSTTQSDKFLENALKCALSFPIIHPPKHISLNQQSTGID